MAKEKLTKIVVRLAPNHPTGSRRRAGFVFGEEPCAIHVTEEQKQQIEDDQCLIVLTKGTAFKQGLENEVTPPGESGTDPAGEDEKAEGKTESDEEPASTAKMTKKELIAALEAKGLVEGKDFDPRAKNDDLTALLQVA